MDARGAADVTPADLHAGPTVHDKVWCMDVDDESGLLPQREMSAREATEWVQLADACEGVPPAAVRAFCDYWGDGPADPREVMDAWRGEEESLAEYAATLAEETGMVPRDLAWPLSCIDWDRAARELELGGDYWTAPAPSGVYVFEAM